MAAITEQLQLIHINPANVEKGKIVGEVPVYAPIDGFVSELNVNLGKYIDAKAVALELINTEHIHLELKVYEKDVLQIKEGQAILFRIPESNQDVIEGIVHVTGKSVHGTDRTIDIHGHVLDSDVRLIHGMYVEAEINVSHDSVMCLPRTAIVEKGIERFVAVQSSVNETAFVMKKIEEGRTTDDWVEILNDADLRHMRIVFSQQGKIWGQ